ncbi:MAG: DUF2079 domain-containing protein [Candidatus Bathyarchaeia archaeon]|jgi:uncharacterized membrane protein|nr:DUF2079 domain-containing protein [Candidatus Bathyarchaeota archaeon A05DMB-4]MDH7595134.1 DUF2079 domain-containing protein [Candidatus Bathyarchaeota archaeon]
MKWLLTTFTHSVAKQIRAIKNVNEEKLENWLNEKIFGRCKGELLVYLAIIIYTIIFSYATILKHYAFRSFAWDLGIVSQSLWTTLNDGRLLYYTPELFFNLSGSYFGLHFSPIMFLLLPIYAIHPAPETLFVFQSFILGLGALPLYWFARDALHNKLIAVAFSLSYLLYAPLHGANWFDFHVQSFLPLFFFLAIYFFEHENWKRYLVFTVLALAIAESVSMVVVFVGLYGLVKYKDILVKSLQQKSLVDKKILVPFATIMLAGSWFLLSRWIQDTFFPIDPRFLEFYKAVDYWSILGVSGIDPITVPSYIILNPIKVAEALAFDAYLKLLFIVLIFGSLLFLSFRSSILIISLSWLVPALLSNEQKFYILGSHYPLYLIPFIFLAAVDGMRKRNRDVKLPRFGNFARNLLILGIIFSLFASPLSPLLLTTDFTIPHFSEYTLPRIGPHELILQEMVTLVPHNASILTQNHIFSHFADRSNAYVYPLPSAFEYAPDAMNDYVNQLFMKSKYVLVDTKYDTNTASDILARIQHYHPSFSLLKSEDGVYLYVK